jgi:hypothetical protein
VKSFEREMDGKFHYRETVTLIRCLTFLAVVTIGDPSILDAVVAWIGRI